MTQLNICTEEDMEPEPNIVFPPVLTPERIEEIKIKVEKFPLATRQRRPNSFKHKPIDIELTDEEFREVWQKIGEIQLNHARKAHKHKYGCERTWETIPGWFAEKAVSKWTGLPWNPTVDKFSEMDVGNFQVRASQYETGLLLTHPEDANEDLVVFVTNSNVLFNRIRGWLWTVETKDYEQSWCKLERGRPCFGVPQWDLRSPESLLPFVT